VVGGQGDEVKSLLAVLQQELGHGVLLRVGRENLPGLRAGLGRSTKEVLNETCVCVQVSFAMSEIAIQYRWKLLDLCIWQIHMRVRLAQLFGGDFSLVKILPHVCRLVPLECYPHLKVVAHGLNKQR